VATPALKELMAGYFHQDWDTYGLDSRPVVELYVTDDPELARLLPEEVAEVLRDHPDDREIESLVRALGCETDALTPSGSYRIWLTELAAYARDALERQPGGE
jgi:hypothetical protein